MRTIRPVCSRCNAAMVPGKVGGYPGLVCPYCGNDTRLAVESDRVRIAQIRADTDRLGMEYRYWEHLDSVRESRTRRRGQIIAICAVALLVAVLIGIYTG